MIFAVLEKGKIMAKYIECRDCTSPDCKGCNLKNLETMLKSGRFDCLMNGNRCINVDADVAPVRRGRWEWFEEWSQSTPCHPSECEDCGWRCSECKTALEDIVGGYWDDIYEKPMINYCPNCGAKMDDE